MNAYHVNNFDVIGHFDHFWLLNFNLTLIRLTSTFTGARVINISGYQNNQSKSSKYNS